MADTNETGIITDNDSDLPRDERFKALSSVMSHTLNGELPVSDLFLSVYLISVYVLFSFGSCGSTLVLPCIRVSPKSHVGTHRQIVHLFFAGTAIR